MSRPDVAPSPSEEPQRFVPTSERGRRTRAAILAAARTVFDANGWADTNVAAITAAAGVGYGSFYVYFSSKEEIFAELTGQLQEDVYVATRSPVAATDPVDRLRIENRLFFEQYRENAHLFQMMEEVGRISPTFRALLAERRRIYTGRLARGITRLQKKGLIDAAINPRYAAEALGAMVERMAFICAQDPSLDLEQVHATLEQLWINAVGMKRDPA